MPDAETRKGRRDQAMLTLLYDSGARVQELADLCVGDLRLDCPAQVKLTGKGRKTRSVPLMDKTVVLLKNYLSEQEMRSLERIVSAYLDLAEDRAERHIPMTMEDWAKRLDLFLMADDREVLQDAGKITAEIAKAKAETEFEKYRVIQDRLFMSDFDKYKLELEENAKK